MTPAELAAVGRVRAMAARGELEAARTALHLTRAEVAAGVDKDPSTVYRWETGESVPRTVHALQLARLMGLLEPDSELVS
ncbi:helix-turn-helix transcriptional regulator [Streptomyces sp. NPDC001812]|uniref:helix-turn-helix transcriptional regulator n=1 Tax=Streptomyces sp. NPDC001812 TaxID=3364611 RepID=UPI0036CF2E67